MAAQARPEPVPAGHYGEGTEGINEVLRRARRLAFPRADGVVEARDRAAGAALLVRIGAEGLLDPLPELVFERLPWPDVVRRRAGAPSLVAVLGSTWGPRWTEAWQRAEVARLLRPPLWPSAGKGYVAAGLFGSEQRALAAGDGAVARWRRGSALHRLAQDVEQALWSAIEWFLLHGTRPAKNPFLPLLALAERGFYDGGVKDGTLRLLAPRSVPSPG